MKPQRVLNPINFLNFFEALKKHVGFCVYLRAEIGKTEVPSCSRTQTIDRVIGAHVKNTISRKRCLSILDLPTNMKPFSCDLGGSGGGYPKPPTTTSTSGIMTVRVSFTCNIYRLSDRIPQSGQLMQFHRVWHYAPRQFQVSGCSL